MKKVNFKKISIKNFLSFGEEPVVLDFKKGLHVITGVNRDKADRQNGLGKSAMMESLYFAIFGTTIRELKKDLIPNTFTNGTCEVVLDFDVDFQSNNDSYKIIRTINPTKLYFYKNGVDITRDSIKNTEEDIHKLLNATPSIFENCVIMTLNNTIPFMAKSKIDKRKFIEGIFNLDVFSRMLNSVRDDYNKKKKDYEIELNKLEDSENNLNSFNTQKQTIINNRKNKISVYEERKENNIVEKNKLLSELEKKEESNLTDIKNNIKKIKDGKVLIENQIDDLTSERADIRASINRNQDLLLKIGVNGTSCPVCLRSVEEHDKEYIKSEKEKINKIISDSKIKITELEKKIEKRREDKIKLDSAYEKLIKKANQLDIEQQKKKNIKDRINQLDIWLAQLDGDIEELKSENTEVDPLISDLIIKLEDLRNSVKSLLYTMNLLDTVKFIVSEEGVKSYVVNKILALFNERIRYYLSRLDANCICNFNEYFEEEIINEKNKVCSYFNFSGAERKALDLSCMFAFNDMKKLQGNVVYNVTVFDELLDSCVDESGIKLIMNVINDRINKNDECVYLITHRKENENLQNADMVFLEKKDGVTRKIDYNPFN